MAEQSGSDDWLSGATIEAEAQDLDVPGVCMTFEGVELPDDPELVS